MRQNWKIITQVSFILGLAFVVLIAVALASTQSFADSEHSRTTVELRDGWMLQSSCKIKGSGAQISKTRFSTAGWHSTTVPSTVVAALVADKTYSDPYFGMNLRSIPGETYPIGKNFSLLPMPKDSPFRCSWWYRAEFSLPSEYDGRHVWLHFGGINYRANVWVNGRRVADDKDIAGAYRTYEFDVTKTLLAGKQNAVAVETFAQTPGDLGVNWVDWNPAPPDKDMGLWNGVYLDDSGPVAIRYPQVVTHFANPSLAEADLTVMAELHNASTSQVTGTLNGAIEDINFRQTYILKPGETREVQLTPDQFPQLRVKDPKVWWPRQMGAQNLHNLALRFMVGNDFSDSQTVRFGIREVKGALDEHGHLLFRVNGQKLLIRGGGWSPDMLLRHQQERLENQFRYVRDLNLNAIRLEGKLESDAFYKLADEQGVMIMAGWCCCDHWELWNKWKAGDLEIATASLRSQIMRMRSHPSMLVWLNGSDNPPPANVEKAYIQVLKESNWPNPYLSSASQAFTTVTGPSGVKMTGPYDHVPPDYWLTDTGKYGGAYGFNTETGPGPAIPPVSSLRKMLPPEDINPDNAVWNYHAGSEGFKNLDHFDKAMAAMYGVPATFADYELKSQLMAYEGERAMFEAYSRNKYTTTGVIQWMLNNAWPSLIWHLYDYYLQPAGGYFGAKKALEPLHVLYSYTDRAVDVVNSEYAKVSGLTVSARLFDVGLHERFNRQVQTDVSSDGVQQALTIPAEAFEPASPVYFVKLTLTDSANNVVSQNFYWLSAKKTAYNWGKTDYKYTPVSSYEDFTALQNLAKVTLKVSGDIEQGPEGAMVRAKIENPSDHLAFQIHLGVQKNGVQDEILPVFWNDNYVELLPGESREFTAKYVSPEALNGGADLVVDGWNIEAATLHLTGAKSAGLESGVRSDQNRSK